MPHRPPTHTTLAGYNTVSIKLCMCRLRVRAEGLHFSAFHFYFVGHISNKNMSHKICQQQKCEKHENFPQQLIIVIMVAYTCIYMYVYMTCASD